MESIQLSSFYQGITSWPKSEMEFQVLVEKIGKLIDVPFVAVSLLDEHDKPRVKMYYPSGNGQISLDLFEDTIRKHVELLESSNGKQPHQVQISNFLPVQHLTISLIVGEARSATLGQGLKVRKDFGWLVVGGSKALDSKAELLLLAVAHRLAELAEISRLETAIHLRSQFLSIASHELKTPLTSIYGILQLQDRMARIPKTVTSPEDEERKRSFLKILLRQVERLNELIDGLLDVSRIQNGRFTIEPTDADVATMVVETVNSRLSLIAQEAGVKIHIDVPASLKVWVDPVRVEEVITNLVMNAIRFSPEGGVVWIKLREEGSSFQLIVRDQGPSVPREDRERIFQPFERTLRTGRFGGLGLGLFISRQIAQLHGGNVSLIESVPGKGNVFEASFPARNLSVVSASA